MTYSLENSTNEKRKEKLIRKNSFIFILSKLDITAMVIPVIVKVWQLANLTFGQMILLQGIAALSTVLFEIPSGAFSDIFKRKTVLISGYATLFLASFLYFLGRNFATFAIAETLFGAGIAIISGSDVSLIYDGLVEVNKCDSYKKVISTATSLSFLTAMITLPISGLIALYNLRLPLLIIALSFAIKTVAFFFAYEPQRKKAVNFNGATKQSVKLLLQSRFLVSIFIASFSFSVFGRAVFWSYQPKLLELSVSTFEIGIIFATLNLIAALSSTVIGRIKHKFEVATVYAFLIGEVLGYFIIWKLHSLFILTGIYALQISRGGRVPIISQILQRELTSDIRATFTSIISALSNFAFFFYSLFLNFYNVDVDNSVLSATLGATILLIAFYVLNNFKGKDKSKIVTSSAS